MKRFIYTPLILAFVSVSTAMTAGCGFVLFGMGTGAFTGAYVMGEVKQTYANGYPEAVRASTETLNELKIAVAEDGGDEAKTTLKGLRSDKTPIEVSIRKIDEQQTEIGVRTGHIGVWDQEASRQMQRLIAERLARKPVAEAPPVETAPPPAAVMPEPPAPVEEPQPPKKKAAPKPPTRASAPVAPAEPAKPASAPAPVPSANFDPEKTLFFPSGTNTLPPPEIAKLDRVAAFLRAHPEAVVSLHGFSDSVGKASQNFMLSVKRADVAKAYLTEKGCSPDQVLVIGHGAARFLGSNDTEAGRRLNRRVEIEIHNGQ